MEDIRETQVTWITSIAYSNNQDSEKNSEKKRRKGEPGRSQAERDWDSNINESSFNSIVLRSRKESGEFWGGTISKDENTNTKECQRVHRRTV